MKSVETQLNEINGELKASKSGVIVEDRGDRLKRRYSIGFWGEETGFMGSTYPRFRAKISKKPGF